MICRYTKTRGGAVALTTCMLLRNCPLLASDLTALPLFLTTSTVSVTDTGLGSLSGVLTGVKIKKA